MWTYRTANRFCFEISFGLAILLSIDDLLKSSNIITIVTGPVFFTSWFPHEAADFNIKVTRHTRHDLDNIL